MGRRHKKHHKSEKSEKLSGEEEKVQTPLKLVLKVGGGTPATTITESPMAESVASEYSGEGGSERKHKHKKKKKKKSGEEKKHRHRGEHTEEKHEKPHKKDRKRTHDVLETGQSSSNHAPSIGQVLVASEPVVVCDPLVMASPVSKRALVMEPEPFETPIQRTFRERQVESGTSQLQACLEYIHKQIHRKDVNGFFGFPVTDNIAPGYSSIINTPMDFSTMKSKIENHEYRSVSEYKKDFKTMCDNCTIYNRPETVYYKEAKRLLSVGFKMMSKEKLILMKKNLSFMSTISNEELGIDEQEATALMAGSTADPTPRSLPKAKPKPKPSKFEAIPDDYSPEDILMLAKEAAKDAADELTLRRPRTKVGFLRRREDGSTTLNIINPSNDGIVGEKERIVDLGQLTGKLTSGMGTITSFKEDKRNKAIPVNYTSYGPFSSFAPSYDSSFANVTKEETDMLLTAYGDDTGLQYALSLKAFVENASPGTNLMVDSLLNVLSGNDHSKANQFLQQKHKKNTEEMVRLAEEQTAAEETGHITNNIDFENLRTLSDELGIDMSFLDAFERNQRPKPQTEEEAVIDAKLEETSALLRDLQKTQHDRLSRKPPPHLAHVPKPCEKETKLAEKVTAELTELAKQALPSDITSVTALRQAMGLTPIPVEGTTEQDAGDEAKEAAGEPIDQGTSADNILSTFSPPAAFTTIATPTANTEGCELFSPDPHCDTTRQEQEEVIEKSTEAQPIVIMPTTTDVTTTEHQRHMVPPGADIVAIAAAHVADDSDADGDIEQDLAEFLQAGPLFGNRGSPSVIQSSGGLDPSDLM